MEKQKILIGFRLGLGDLVLVTPILRSLRKTYSDSYITIMVRPEFLEVAKRLPYINNAITSDKKASSTWKIVREIRKIKYDAIFCLDQRYRTALISFLAGIPIRAGFKGNRGIFMTKSVDKLSNYEEIYEPSNYAYALTETTGISIDGDLTHLEFPERNTQEKINVDKLLENAGDFIVVAPFSSKVEKNWPIDYYQQFINKIKKSCGMNVVIIGAPNKQGEKLESVINLIGKTTIFESAEIISRAKLFVGGCCANLHIAAAVGTPMVALYGPTSSKRWAPKHNIKVIENLPKCNLCFMKNVSCNENVCMTKISVESVLNACTSMLKVTN